MGYNFVADNMGLSSFIQLLLSLLASKYTKSREILREFELISGQGHPRSSILVSIERACDFLLVINSNFGRISREGPIRISGWNLGLPRKN